MRGASQRQRVELTLTALLPAALGLLGTLAGTGRLCWLAPVLALPFGLALCRLWRELGEADLSCGLEGTFGRGLGKGLELAYFLWGLVLLAGSAGAYARRLRPLLEGAGGEELALAAALAVCLWLGRRGEGTFARTGRVFFLAAAVTLALALALALPGVDVRNLWPLEGADWAGVSRGAALCLSLAGYGIYALCLPRDPADGMAAWPWAAGGCGALAWLLLTTAGTFGPRLAQALEEPFYFLLQGVRAPGAFRRGEAALTAALTLADLALLSLLARGCRSLWENLTSGRAKWLGYAAMAGAFLAAWALPEEASKTLLQDWVPMGNLVLGAAVPALAVLTGKVRKRREGTPIFCSQKRAAEEDVGETGRDKKSHDENEKKC